MHDTSTIDDSKLITRQELSLTEDEDIIVTSLRKRKVAYSYQFCISIGYRTNSIYNIMIHLMAVLKVWKPLTQVISQLMAVHKYETFPNCKRENHSRACQGTVGHCNLFNFNGQVWDQCSTLLSINCNIWIYLEIPNSSTTSIANIFMRKRNSYLTINFRVIVVDIANKHEEFKFQICITGWQILRIKAVRFNFFQSGTKTNIFNQLKLELNSLQKLITYQPKCHFKYICVIERC